MLFGVEKPVSRRFACSPDGRSKSESEGYDGFLLVQALRAFRGRGHLVVERRRGGADGVRADQEMPVLVRLAPAWLEAARIAQSTTVAAAVGLAEQLHSVSGASREREGEAVLAAGGCGGRAPRCVRSVQEGSSWSGRPCPGRVRTGSNSVGRRAKPHKQGPPVGGVRQGESRGKHG